MVTPAKIRRARLAERTIECTASAASRWTSSVDLSDALPRIIYESAMRYFLGDSLWSRYGSELCSLYRGVVEVSDIRRIALSRTPLRYAMSEYRAARRLQNVLGEILRSPLAESSPAVREINRVQVESAGIAVGDRPWILMFLLWNAVAYSGSYAIWALIDILTKPDIRQRFEVGAPDRVNLASRCLWETIRLHPLGIVTRKVKQELIYRDQHQACQIPAGEYVGTLVTAVTKDPERFPEPEIYNPDRYLVGPPPLDVIYGRGPFGCVGREFSRILITTVLVELLDQHSMRLISAPPRRHSRLHLLYPKVPVVAAVHRRAG